MHSDGVGAALFAGGTSISIGSASSNCIAKWNGTGWSNEGEVGGTAARSIQTLHSFDDGSGAVLCAGGAFDSVDGVAADSIARRVGTTWRPFGHGATTGTVQCLASFDDGTGTALYAGGVLLTALDGVPVSGSARWTGNTWSPIAAPQALDVHAMATCDFGQGPQLYAARGCTTYLTCAANGLYRLNGGAWDVVTAFEPAWGGWFDTLSSADLGAGMRLFGAGGVLSIGGELVKYAAIFDGANWSPFKEGKGLVYEPSTMKAFDDGSGPALFLGSTNFIDMGSNVIRWNGSSWSALPFAPNGAPQQFEVFDDGTGPALYLAHSTSVKKWNGSAWSDVGAPMNGVNALAVHTDATGTALYAAGTFTQIGSLPANRVAKWNGTVWSPLGTGLPTYAPNASLTKVSALISHDDGSGAKLYAAGTFGPAYNGAAPDLYNVARWNGSSFEPVGLGFRSSSPNPGAVGTPVVTCLEVFDAGSGPLLYASGYFHFSGTTTTTRIAKWNGTSWSGVASGLSSSSGLSIVRDLEVYDDGAGPSLYAAGAYGNAGFSPVNNIAKWDGTAPWIALDSGTDGDVRTLAAYSDSAGPALYLGGAFQHVGGGISSHYVARWAPRRPGLRLAATPSSGTNLVTITNEWLEAGHEYFNVFSTESCGLVGSGPYLGLCASDPSSLLFQVAFPIGTAPFHFASTSGTMTFGPYAVPGPLMIDAVSIELTSTTGICVSPVRSIVLP